MKIGKRLKELREDPARWASSPPTAAQAARALGVNRSTVARWERGTRSIPSAALVAWLDWLNATPAERAAIFGGDDGL